MATRRVTTTSSTITRKLSFIMATEELLIFIRWRIVVSMARGIVRTTNNGRIGNESESFSPQSKAGNFQNNAISPSSTDIGVALRQFRC